MSKRPEPWRVDRRRRSRSPGAPVANKEAPPTDPKQAGTKQQKTPSNDPGAPESPRSTPNPRSAPDSAPDSVPGPPAPTADQWPVKERHMEIFLIGTGILYVLLLFDIYYDGFISSLDKRFIDLVALLPDTLRALLGVLLSIPGERWLLALIVLATSIHLLMGGQRGSAVIVATSAFSFMLFIEFTKWVIGRPRPTTYFAGTDWMPEWFYSTSMAFPSGHSAAPLFVYGIVLVALYGPRQNRESLLPIPTQVPRNILLAALALAFLPGIGRILWGMHWTSDVIAGWLLGTAWLAGTLLVAIAWQRSTGADWTPEEVELEPSQWAQDERP